MKPSLLPVLFLVAIALAAVACSGGDSKPATPTATARTAPTVQATVTSEATAAPTSLPTPGGSVPSTVQLVDVRSGKVTTLYQDWNTAAYNARFDGDTVVVAVGTALKAFKLDGSVATAPAAPACQPAGQKPIYCSFSPDGRWATYPVENGEKTLASGYTVPLWDQWVMEVATGKMQMVQAGLIHCGGCDGRYGPVWSPNSRYVAYAEYGGTGRRFLTDVQTGATRQIGTGAEIGEAPAWSADGSRLLYQEEDNGTVARLEDLSAGTSATLSVPWPAAFDASGTLIYSPAWNPDPKRAGSSTTIIEARTGKTVAVLPGAAPWFAAYGGGPAVGIREGSFVAALQDAPGCAGTAIYTGGSTTPECVAGGADIRLSADASVVAIARETGAAGPLRGPGFESSTANAYAVDLVTVGGSTRTVVTGAVSFQPLLMVWNAAGTHLLVLWPHAGGIGP